MFATAKRICSVDDALKAATVDGLLVGYDTEFYGVDTDSTSVHCRARLFCFTLAWGVTDDGMVENACFVSSDDYSSRVSEFDRFFRYADCVGHSLYGADLHVLGAPSVKVLADTYSMQKLIDPTKPAGLKTLSEEYFGIDTISFNQACYGQDKAPQKKDRIDICGAYERNPERVKAYALQDAILHLKLYVHLRAMLEGTTWAKISSATKTKTSK